jgi:hypothetical protein
MRTIFFILTLVFLFSCGEKRNLRKFSLTLSNGSGWSYGSSLVECDSFQMEGTKKAFIWVDGTKMKVEAENSIYPHTR